MIYTWISNVRQITECTLDDDKYVLVELFNVYIVIDPV